MAAPQTRPHLLRLRYAGTCSICLTVLPPGTEAWWYAHVKEIVCLSCRPVEPESTRRWGKQTAGEQALAARLTELAGERLVVLHDLRMPASRGIIDHLAVTPRGVFVIDVKHYAGPLERRNVGNIIRTDMRLFVGGRDHTSLLNPVEDEAAVVRDALRAMHFVDVPVHGVLCFVGAEWGLFGSPFKLSGVLVTYPKFLYKLLGKDADVATSAIQDAAAVLATALPSA
jgi:nuclease-like protein